MADVKLADEFAKKDLVVSFKQEMSPTIGNLAKALAKVQGALKPAKKDKENPFYKSSYADLASVWEAVKGPLSANELAITQTPSAEYGPDVVALITTLMHGSGEWIRGTLLMKPSKIDPQGVGSCLTYARRYALGAITGISTEEDDDGNAGSKPATGSAPIPPGGLSGLITEPQVRRLFMKLKEAQVDSEDLKEHLVGNYNISSTSKIEKKHYDTIIDWIISHKKEIEP